MAGNAQQQNPQPYSAAERQKGGRTGSLTAENHSGTRITAKVEKDGGIKVINA